MLHFGPDRDHQASRRTRTTRRDYTLFGGLAQSFSEVFFPAFPRGSSDAPGETRMLRLSQRRTTPAGQVAFPNFRESGADANLRDHAGDAAVRPAALKSAGFKALQVFVHGQLDELCHRDPPRSDLFALKSASGDDNQRFE